MLALFRFFFRSGLPPLVGTCGAKVTWETNCFSVANTAQIWAVFAEHHFDRFHSDGIDVCEIDAAHSV